MDSKIWLLNYGAGQVVGFSGVRFDRPFTPPRHRFTKFDSSWSVGPETFSVVIPVCFSKLTGHQRGFECFVRHGTQSITIYDECQVKSAEQAKIFYDFWVLFTPFFNAIRRLLSIIHSAELSNESSFAFPQRIWCELSVDLLFVSFDLRWT